MKNLFMRFMGLFLVAIALLGIIICCVGIFGVWRFKSAAEKETIEMIDLVSETIDSAAQGITSTQSSLDAAIDSITSLDDSLEVVGGTIDNSTHFFDTTYTLTSEILPDTVRTTQKAIQAAAKSAKIVDDTLSVVAAIPLIGSGYKPDVPLSDALQEISVSLDRLPGTSVGISDDVLEIKGDMLALQAKIIDAKVQTERIKTSLSQAKDVLVKLNGLTSRLQPRLAAIRQQVTRGFNILAWCLTIFLVWFALAQLGLIVQGIQLIFTDHTSKEPIKNGQTARGHSPGPIS